MKTMTTDEFHEAIKLQGCKIKNVTFCCPACKTLQSAQDLIDAGAGKNVAEVEKYLAFSCIGRFTKDKGCDWTLGGLFKIHTLEIITEEGKRRPCFEPMMPMMESNNE